MRVIAIFELPDGSKPLNDAEVSYLDNQNHYQWMRTREVRKLPPKTTKVRLVRRKD